MTMKKEYRYSGVIRGSEIVYRPILGIVLTRGDRQYETVALLDSGADSSVADADLAIFLGIDPLHCRKGNVTGIVGSARESFVAPISVSVEGFDGTFNVDMTFVKGANTSIILGQNDFFSLFKIYFEKRRRKFSLEEES